MAHLQGRRTNESKTNPLTSQTDDAKKELDDLRRDAVEVEEEDEG